MRSLVPVLVSDRQFRLPTTKTIWLASLLLEPETPSEKCEAVVKKVFCADTSDFCLKCTLGIKMCTKLVSPHDFLLSQCRHQLRR